MRVKDLLKQVFLFVVILSSDPHLSTVPQWLRRALKEENGFFHILTNIIS
jgi:hypothetical protein